MAKVSPFVPAITLAAAGGAREGREDGGLLGRAAPRVNGLTFMMSTIGRWSSQVSEEDVTVTMRR